MRRLARVAAAARLLALARALPSRRRRPIRVGSKNFTEQVLLGEIAAQALEARGRARRAQARSRRHVRLPPRAARRRARPLPGVHRNRLHRDPRSRSRSPTRRACATRSRAEYARALGAGLVAAARLREHVRARHARRRRRAQLGIARISDLARHRDRCARGSATSSSSAPTASRASPRPTGSRSPRGPREMDLGLLYAALAQGQVDVVAGQLDGRPDRGDAPRRARGRPPLLPAVRGGLRGARDAAWTSARARARARTALRRDLRRTRCARMNAAVDRDRRRPRGRRARVSRGAADSNSPGPLIRVDFRRISATLTAGQHSYVRRFRAVRHRPTGRSWAAPSFSSFLLIVSFRSRSYVFCQYLKTMTGIALKPPRSSARSRSEAARACARCSST